VAFFGTAGLLAKRIQCGWPYPAYPWLTRLPWCAADREDASGRSDVCHGGVYLANK